MPDWGVGHYESAAMQLWPAAQVVVQAAAIGPTERVLDVGCGTGNAALLAAEHSGAVTGVDPAVRLLEVAKSRAASEGKKLAFLPGDVAALPVDDSSVDVILSVFGVIFASEPRAAAAEMSRVLTSRGRIVLSAWVPSGTMYEMNWVAAETVRGAVGRPPGPEAFAWHDHDALSNLLATYGFEVGVAEHRLAFTASSARDFLDHESRNHPLAVAGFSVLERVGGSEALHARLLGILEDGNEEPDGFRVTSTYVVATARRGG